MSDLREPLHQPPNPEDLRRVPPDNPFCARIRGLLRDFVDGDLGRDLCVEVEEHAHRCRVCAVELSRAEHERLMVCRAFAALGHGPSLSPGFSDRVVQRLMDETSIEPARDAAEAAAAGKPVGARIRTSPEPNPGIWARLAAGRHTLLVTGLLVLLCAAIVLSCSLVADREPEHSARLVVTWANGAYGVQGEFKEGDGLGNLQSLWVGAGGVACLEWHDDSSLRQPAAKLDVRGGGELRLQSGAPLLVNGKIGIVTTRPVEIPMADGNSLRLGLGEYVIAAEVPSDWMNGPDQSPNNPFELHVEVEVLGGHQAEIRRSTGSAFVSAGEIGVYQGDGSVTYRAGSGGLAANQGTVPERRPPAEGSPNQTNFQGRVVDRYWLPNEGAAVHLTVTSGGMPRGLTLISEADGSFSETMDFGCDRPFAIVQVEPAAVRLDLGVTPPQAMPVTRLQSYVELARPLVLNLAAPLRGRVRDDFDIPRSHVRVLPCIVDELFGSVLPLMTGQTTTDVEGDFQIHRLPSRLPPHQHLAVLLLDPLLEPTFVPVPERGSEFPNGWWGPLSMVARRLHPVQLSGLTHNTPVEILEEVPGLRGESAVVKRPATTNSSGRVNNFPIGSGRLWWRLGNAANPLVRELVIDTSVSFLRYRPSGPSLARSSVFRQMTDIGGTDLQVVYSYRHQRLFSGTAGTGDQGLLVVDSLGHAVADAQVFSLAASGPRDSVDTSFHGFTSAAGFFPLTGVTLGSQLFVLGPDGATGQVTLGFGPPLITVTLAATGRAQLGEQLRPTGSEAGEILTLRFEFLGQSIAGMHPVAVRFACAARGWEVSGLPSGEYRTVIGETVHQFVVPSGGFVVVH
ncbi:MAG TPA: hypothetical protein VFD82_17700 [Planctomycetota bacterium]|nr:hypothetical protein [Planctomycetota bacterium]